MKKIAFWGSAVLVACIAGLASVAVLLGWAARAGAIESGVWRTNPVTGSPEAGMYTRAIVSVHGLLALGPEETVYYSANTDSSGEPLSGDCTYRLEGEDLPARWWSITPYGPDYYLIPHGADHYSITMTSIERRPDGGYTAVISARPQEGNWLPVKRGQGFDLTARLYNPRPEVYQNPAEVDLPTIVREDCA